MSDADSDSIPSDPGLPPPFPSCRRTASLFGLMISLPASSPLPLHPEHFPLLHQHLLWAACPHYPRSLPSFWERPMHPASQMRQIDRGRHARWCRPGQPPAPLTQVVPIGASHVKSLTAASLRHPHRHELPQIPHRPTHPHCLPRPHRPPQPQPPPRYLTDTLAARSFGLHHYDRSGNAAVASRPPAMPLAGTHPCKLCPRPTAHACAPLRRFPQLRHFQLLLGDVPEKTGNRPRPAGSRKTA